jgi:hypothetical protein
MREWRKASDRGPPIELIDHKSDGEEATVIGEKDLFEDAGVDGQLVCEGEAEPNQDDQVDTARKTFAAMRAATQQ